MPLELNEGKKEECFRKLGRDLPRTKVFYLFDDIGLPNHLPFSPTTAEALAQFWVGWGETETGVIDGGWTFPCE